MKPILLGSLFAVALGSSAAAELCDYRPSALVGAGASAAKQHSGAALQTAGSAAKAAGFYTLTQVVSGGTGTTGVLGSMGGVAAVLTAPATIIGAAIVGGGSLIYEGYCYYAVDDRRTSPEEVLPVLQNLSENADSDFLRVVDLTVAAEQMDVSVTPEDLETGETHLLKLAKSWNTHGRPMTWTSYRVSRLYIVNGELRYKDFGRDTRIGDLGFVIPQPEDAPATLPETPTEPVPADPATSD